LGFINFLGFDEGWVYFYFLTRDEGFIECCGVGYWRFVV
jgi:hypothetical protein